MLVYIGTYTSEGSEGIYACEFDPATGALGDLRPMARTANPTYLCLHPDRPYLYAANEVGDAQGERSGAVSAYAIGEGGALTLLNEQSSHGTSACYVSVDGGGRYVLVANYSSGTVAALPIQGGGALGEASDVVQHQGSGADPQRQDGPHAHCIVPDPGGQFILSCDLGADRVMVYRLDTEAGRLLPATTPSVRLAPGAGPRHVAFHPNCRWAYVINELGNTMAAFTYDPDLGLLTEIGDVSTLPEGYTETSYCADVHVAPSGRYVYGSNRGHDSIVILRVDEATGMVEPIGWESTQGSFPRNFYLSPDGTWLLAANQKGNNVVSYRVDVESGLLEPTGHSLEVSMPVCLLPLF